MAGSGGFVTVEAANGPAAYRLSVRQGTVPVVITSVAPLSGGPGTLVTITGSGFIGPELLTAYFGEIPAKLISATPTALLVQVPALGVNGAVTVLASGGTAIGPQFTTGRTAAPDAFLRPRNFAAARHDPLSGATVDVTRLAAVVDPLATQADVEALIGPLKGVIAGHFPESRTYVLEFTGNSTLRGLEALRRQIALSPLVASATTLRDKTIDSNRVDSRDTHIRLNGGAFYRAGLAYEQIALYEALDAIRRTPPFDDPIKFRKVRIAVIDTGFKPFREQEFGPSAVVFVQGNRAPCIPPLPGSCLTLTATTAAADRRDTAVAHGTSVTGVIAAANDGSEVSGVMNAVLQQGELPAGHQPFAEVIVYECPGLGPIAIDGQCATLAKKDLADRARSTPATPTILNLSYGGDYVYDTARFTAETTRLLQDFLPLVKAGVFVVGSAGNDGIHDDADVDSAAVLAAGGLVIGGTTLPVGTRGNDRRVATTDPSPRNTADDRPCDTGGSRVKGSNCGRGIVLTAPGESVLTTSPASPGYTFQDGTSFAAPMVAGVAALLQAIRPSDTPLTQAKLREYLVNTADDITQRWDATTVVNGAVQRIGRLNALAAVRKVLAPPATQAVYVSDSAIVGGPGGSLVTLNIDPLTGTRTTPEDVSTILELPWSSFGRPRRSVASSTNDRLYVIADGPPALRHGVVVFNTHTGRAEDFIPFSGTDVVARTGAPRSPLRSPVLVPDAAGLVLSSDERLLFVAGGSRLFVINTETRRLVRRNEDLPHIYRPTLATLGDVRARLNAIRSEIGPDSLTDLALSPDGRVLYGVVSSGGGGTGDQPGHLLAINVDLYTDVDTLSPGLQSNNDDFLRIRDSVLMTGSDGPSSVAVNPVGGHVYVPHDGIRVVFGVPAADVSSITYSPLVTAELVGHGATGSAGAAEQKVALDLLTQQTRDGVVLLDAPGFTNVFVQPATGSLQSVGKFPSEVVFGWQPPAANAGRVVNHFHFEEVYAKRPSSIAMRPDGARALVSFPDTGNFGVLDAAVQQSLPPTFPAPAGVFRGLVGVTQAIDFTRDRSPSRGAFRSADDPPKSVAGLDERFRFGGWIQYAQNGAFAVAVQEGSRPPHDVDVALPDFAQEHVRQRLVASGFSIQPGAASGFDPDGMPVQARGSYASRRNGGAITIIHDEALTADLQATKPDIDGRPYFSTRPVCKVASSTHDGCAEHPYERLRTYTPAGSMPRDFDRPRGIAIQPFVGFETPRHGDVVFPTTPVVVRWRDERVDGVSVRVTRVGGASQPTFVSGSEIVNKSFSLKAETLILRALGNLTPGRYRFAATARDSNGVGDISSAAIEFTLEP
jgi:hypothetical protein